MSAEFYECKRCGAAFGIAGEAGTDDDGTADESYQAEVQFHEDKLCTPLIRTALERARLLVDVQWDTEDELPSDAAASALLAIAEEQHTANLIAVLALPSAAKTKAITDAKNRLTFSIVERLGLDGA